MSRIYLVLTIVLLLIPTSVSAVGLKVTPAELELSGRAGEEIKTVVEVENITDRVALFDLYIDSGERMFTISPSSFILESGESKEVTFSVEARDEGLIKTNLSVVSGPLRAREFTARGGVKVPVTVSVNDSLPLLSAAGLAVANTGMGDTIAVGMLIFAILLLLLNDYILPKVRRS